LREGTVKRKEEKEVGIIRVGLRGVVWKRV
jgi:hypothetical protein